MNRITESIKKLAKIIETALLNGKDAKGKNFNAETVRLNAQRLDLDLPDYATLQSLKSAYMGILLTEEEAQTVYSLLGNTPDHYNQQPLAVKMTIFKLFSELLNAKISEKKNNSGLTSNLSTL